MDEARDNNIEEDIFEDHTREIARDITKPKGKMHALPVKNRDEKVPPIVVTAKSTIVYTQTEDYYKIVQRVIKNAGYQYHTYTQQEGKTHDFILKGLESAPEPKERTKLKRNLWNLKLPQFPIIRAFEPPTAEIALKEIQQLAEPVRKFRGRAGRVRAPERIPEVMKERKNMKKNLLSLLERLERAGRVRAPEMIAEVLEKRGTLEPQMFDNLMEVINEIGQYNENTGNYGKPTLPTEVGTALKYLIQIYILECIKNDNMNEKEMIYIFGLPQCRPNDRNVVYRHLSATTSMRKYSQECNAENPQSLRATTLRKHIATVSMSLNLNNEEIQLLQGYLGHADKIHKEYYRQPLIERDILNVSRVLHAAQSTFPVLATVFQNIPNTSTAEQPGTPTTSAVPSTSAIISRSATPSTSAIPNTSGTILPDTMGDSFKSGSEFNANNNDSDDSNCEELINTNDNG
ncbi:hypothetical protein JTB14_015361 [Gonioctena quinquepunctata]|nr:hypothetical protein JTB14_015361 [Gonioctena quinquepunctata]